jgi:GTP-binding protein
MGRRRGELKDMRVEQSIMEGSPNMAFLEFEIPTRGLIGYRSEFLTDTKGQGIINSLFLEYRPVAGGVETNPHGSLIAFEDGTSTGYGLAAAQERGQMFIGPGVEVYAGMVVGQNAKPEDLEVNVAKDKRLSNLRSKGDGEGIRLDVPRNMTLEDAMSYLGDDELLEVTPQVTHQEVGPRSHQAQRADSQAGTERLKTRRRNGRKGRFSVHDEESRSSVPMPARRGCQPLLTKSGICDMLVCS